MYIFYTYLFIQITDVLHDKMTECRYMKPIETFDHGFRPENWFEVNILEEGRTALEKVNSKLGIYFEHKNSIQLKYYFQFF